MFIKPAIKPLSCSQTLLSLVFEKAIIATFPHSFLMITVLNWNDYRFPVVFFWDVAAYRYLLSHQGPVISWWRSARLDKQQFPHRCSSVFVKAVQCACTSFAFTWCYWNSTCNFEQNAYLVNTLPAIETLCTCGRLIKANKKNKIKKWKIHVAGYGWDKYTLKPV